MVDHYIENFNELTALKLDWGRNDEFFYSGSKFNVQSKAGKSGNQALCRRISGNAQ
jgi:hypothetical protein